MDEGCYFTTINQKVYSSLSWSPGAPPMFLPTDQEKKSARRITVECESGNVGTTYSKECSRGRYKKGEVEGGVLIEL